MSKVLLVAPSNISDAPYVQYYIRIFEINKVDYDVLYWNRLLEDTHVDPSNYYSWDVYSDALDSAWKKMYHAIRFGLYVRKHLQKHEYSSLVVFTVTYSIFMERFLSRWFKGRFIFDVRDHSPLCNTKIFNCSVEKLVENSAYTVVSSEGFLKWMPKNKTKYLVDHNVGLELLKACYDEPIKNMNKEHLNILTIGQLRDDVANAFVMDSFANNKGFFLTFAGSGWALPILQKHAEDRGIKNVFFTGRYQKKDELDIIRQSDMVNAFTGDDINSRTLMTNRFYNAVLCCKPLIVNADTFQAQLCKKYDLGVIVDENADMEPLIHKYISEFDKEKYLIGRSRFLDKIIIDLKQFETSIVNIVKWEV